MNKIHLPKDMNVDFSRAIRGNAKNQFGIQSNILLYFLKLRKHKGENGTGKSWS